MTFKGPCQLWNFSPSAEMIRRSTVLGVKETGFWSRLCLSLGLPNFYVYHLYPHRVLVRTQREDV